MRCTVCVIRREFDPKGFDQDGVCSFCRSYERELERNEHRKSTGELERIIGQIKTEGRDKPHDVIIGISGGVDSSYLAYQAVELGLRPLAIHLDNGWNSELATDNINRLVSGLGLELATHVIDWREFRALQVAYFRASVIDIEVLTDHAITAYAYRTAIDEGIGYILSGNNLATESGMPPSWNYAKHDLRNLKAIAKRFGDVPVKTLPTASSLELFRARRKVQTLDLLNLLDYDKEAAIATLSREFGWRPYGGKHYESLFTQFYQAHVLPTKFGVDKREAHGSALIRSGQATRAAILAQLETPLYEPIELQHHRQYVLKKLGLSDGEFDAIMATPPRPHTSLPNDQWYYGPILKSYMLLAEASYRPRRWLRSRRRRTTPATPVDQKVRGS